jgi:phthalate 4,5-dioxygenase oxygenase subunit
VLGTKKGGNARVPMDDHHTMTFSMVSGRNAPSQANPIRVAMQPNTSDWFGRWRPVQDPSNDYQIDRQAQRENTGSAGYTGISGIAMQDAAMTTSMGEIYDRSKERLGTTDAMVIRVRRRLIAAVEAHMKHGIVPPGVDDPSAYRVRSGGVFLPPDADWVEATRELRMAFVEHPELDPALNGPL